MTRYLLIAAFPPEIEPLGAWVRARSDLALGLCGVGMVQAAARSVELIQIHKPQHVLFIGSVGATSKDIALLSLHTASEVFLADQNILDAKAFLPEASAQRYESEPEFRRKIESLSAGVVSSPAYSTLGITRDEALAKVYGSAFAHSAENLELFGVAAACALKGIFWNSLSCVTNHIGSAAHSEWKERVEVAAEHTARAIIELFDQSSPDLGAHTVSKPHI